MDRLDTWAEIREREIEDHGYVRGRCKYCGSKMATDSGVWVCDRTECDVKWRLGEEPDDE